VENAENWAIEMIFIDSYVLSYPTVCDNTGLKN
jgi:hypothetical protein